jgi:hypothetical protein
MNIHECPPFTLVFQFNFDAKREPFLSIEQGRL